VRHSCRRQIDQQQLGEESHAGVTSAPYILASVNRHGAAKRTEAIASSVDVDLGVLVTTYAGDARALRWASSQHPPTALRYTAVASVVHVGSVVTTGHYYALLGDSQRAVSANDSVSPTRTTNVFTPLPSRMPSTTMLFVLRRAGPVQAAAQAAASNAGMAQPSNILSQPTTLPREGRPRRSNRASLTAAVSGGGGSSGGGGGRSSDGCGRSGGGSGGGGVGSNSRNPLPSSAGPGIRRRHRSGSTGPHVSAAVSSLDTTAVLRPSV
jgi:hypothetical protein